MPQTKNINLVPGVGPTQYINVSQNDVGREILLNLKDNSDWYDLTGCTVTLAGTKPSGLGYTVAGTIDGHQVTITTTEQMTDEYGTIASELKITKNDTVIGSANVILSVEKDPHPDGTTDGSADQLIPELTILVERVEAAVAKAEVLQEAEAWAVGKRDGVDVDQDDDTYHNNSKYYSEQASGSAAAAAGSAAAASSYAGAAGRSAESAEESAEAAETAARDAAEVASEEVIEQLREYKEDTEANAAAAAASASDASYQRSESLRAKTDAEAAAADAAEAAQQAANVFQIAGSTSFSVDPTTKKVTMHVTVSE